MTTSKANWNHKTPQRQATKIQWLQPRKNKNKFNRMETKSKCKNKSKINQSTSQKSSSISYFKRAKDLLLSESGLNNLGSKYLGT